jgi:hypothetical protein
MKYSFFVLFTLLFNIRSAGQERVILALPIEAVSNISADKVDITLTTPAGIALQVNQTFLCKGKYISEDADTATIGAGAITKLGESFIQCSIKNPKSDRPVKQGDICYFMVDKPKGRDDIFFILARLSINFKSVLDTIIFDAPSSLSTWNNGKTNTLIASLLEDIHFTAAQMILQEDNQQQLISGGDFDGKLLFNAMKEATESDLLHFLRYICVRPTKYIGSIWSISEVFATWMTNKTPHPNDDILLQ